MLFYHWSGVYFAFQLIEISIFEVGFEKILRKKFAGWRIFSDRVAAYVAGKFEFKHLKVITFSGVANASFVSRLLLSIYRFYTK